MLDLNKMTPEEFRVEIAKFDKFDVASMATQIVNSRGNNISRWEIKVYPNEAIENYTKAVVENKSELKFWCYLNEDKSIIHTSVYKTGQDEKIELSATIDRFGDKWWFEAIGSELKKLIWI